MKKICMRIFSVVVFLIVGFIIFGRISEVLRRKAGGASDMVHSIYSLEENTTDVLCLGSSHGYSAIQPNILWNEYGITSYVMCSQRQTVATSYYLLKEALNYQQPKVVLLESYYFWYKGKYVKEKSEVQLRQAADSLRPGKVKFEMLEDFLSDMTWSEKLSFYIPFIKYHPRWADLKSYDFVRKLYLKGGILDFTVSPTENPGIPEGFSDIPEITLEYLDKIIELCREKDMQLVIYEAPYAAKSNYVSSHKVTNSLEKYLEEKEIPFLYYQKTNAAGIDFSADLRDASHLNTNGAVKISRHLGAFIMDNYNLTDHREEEEYQSWNEDYELFMADVEAAGGTIE